MATEGIRLLADGAPVTLKDGTQRRLILDMEALAVIEERMGSLSAYVEGLQRGFRGKHVSAVLAGLEAALRHYRDPRGDPEFTRRRIASLVYFDRLTTYADALDQAWDEGIPMAEPRGKAAASKKARRSRGQNSSDGSRSTTAAALGSSGE